MVIKPHNVFVTLYIAVFIVIRWNAAESVRDIVIACYFDPKCSERFHRQRSLVRVGKVAIGYIEGRVNNAFRIK